MILKPIEHVEKRLILEIFIEIIIFFILSCVLTFVLPLFLGLRSRAVQNSESYFNFLSFLFNKDGRSYPFVLICGLIATIVYALSQLKNRKAIEFVIEKDKVVIFFRNPFSGTITSNILIIDDIKVLKKDSEFRAEYYKIYNKKRYIGDFCPKYKPWNEKRDANTINKVKEILEVRIRY